MAASTQFIGAFTVNDARFTAAVGADSPGSRSPPKIALYAISLNDLARQHQCDKDACAE